MHGNMIFANKQYSGYRTFCTYSGFHHASWIVRDLGRVLWKHSCHPNRVWWGDVHARFKRAVLLCGVDSGTPCTWRNVSFCFILSCGCFQLCLWDVSLVPNQSDPHQSFIAVPTGKTNQPVTRTQITATNRPTIERADQSRWICFQMSHMLSA